ncbi:Cell division protein DivIC (FtsB), stabilizes FtsL against RasP cleavage [hydrothermal vent metagenome]|uniref:Cell division protein DivIC (FtsB), stabilizes FtsL against RasP cleavage n=1 Tax=hydrothermal vent metagenome TaxID=652676 RepID=A0A3B1BLZ1_9ZZZZ
MKILAAILLFLFLLLQYDLWVGDGSMATVHHLQQAVQSQKLENAKLKQRNAALAADVQDLKQGLDAVEERARSELGMIKKGETFVQVTSD